MNALTYPLMLIAAAGFLASASAHLLALFGKSLPGGGLVWILHLGVFVVWIPSILLAQRTLHGVTPANHMKTILARSPLWMSRAVKILFAYAMLNFILFMASTIGHPKPTGLAPPAVIRGFSGHWMIFYAAAFVTLYSLIKSAPAGTTVKNSNRQSHL